MGGVSHFETREIWSNYFDCNLRHQTAGVWSGEEEDLFSLSSQLHYLASRAAGFPQLLLASVGPLNFPFQATHPGEA